MSRSRGFSKLALLVVCHSGRYDNTVGLVEELRETENKDLFVTVETLEHPEYWKTDRYHEPDIFEEGT